MNTADTCTTIVGVHLGYVANGYSLRKLNAVCFLSFSKCAFESYVCLVWYIGHYFASLVKSASIAICM